jgi:hypothetical protein
MTLVFAFADRLIIRCLNRRNSSDYTLLNYKVLT